MPLGYVLTAYALVFFIGVFVGTNAADWLDKRSGPKAGEKKKTPPFVWRG